MTIDLVGANKTKLCQGFEEGRNLQKYGEAMPVTSDFSIASGPSKSYFSGKLLYFTLHQPNLLSEIRDTRSCILQILVALYEPVALFVN